MEGYKELPLWKAAAALSRDVDTLTKTFPEYNTLVRMLREKTTGLSLTIATDAPEKDMPRTDALKRAYEQAHDAEYVLLFSLIFRYVPYADARGLFEKIYNVKRLIVEALK
jgi:hypothetical protein